MRRFLILQYLTHRIQSMLSTRMVKSSQLRHLSCRSYRVSSVKQLINVSHYKYIVFTRGALLPNISNRLIFVLFVGKARTSSPRETPDYNAWHDAVHYESTTQQEAGNSVLRTNISLLPSSLSHTRTHSHTRFHANFTHTSYTYVQTHARGFTCHPLCVGKLFLTN